MRLGKVHLALALGRRLRPGNPTAADSPRLLSKSLLVRTAPPRFRPPPKPNSALFLRYGRLVGGIRTLLLAIRIASQPGLRCTAGP